MSDSLNKVLSKLVTSIEGVKNEREMLLRLIIGLAVFLLLAVFKKQISKAVVWLCTKTLARKSELAQKALVDALSTPLSFFVLVLGIYVGTEIIAPSGEIRSPVLLIFKLGIIFSIAWFLINFINSDFSFVLKDDDSKTKKTAVNFISNLIKIIVVIYGIVIVIHMVSMGSPLPGLLKSTVVSFIMVAIAIVLKNVVKKPNLPGFAWATLVAFFLTLPISPLSDTIVELMSAYSFGLVGIPLLSFAGIAVGEQLEVFKKLSWKIVIISFVVMASTYFGSAAISNIILAAKGLI